MHALLWTIACLVPALLVWECALGLPWIGRTTRVVDGDSVETRTRGSLRRIRLCGVDAPEYRQEHGREARKALAGMVEGRRVLFVPAGRDVYGRFPCVMLTSSGPVSWRMALAGHAWPDSVATAVLHVPARLMRRGLWAGERIVAPKVWRMAGSNRRAHRTPFGS